jgi:hypothetical protein
MVVAEDAEENYVKEAVWRCFLASLGQMTLHLESPIWSQVAAFSDAHPELYAFPTTESAWDTLDELITKVSDPVAIHGWRSNARTVTQQMLNAADDLILRVHNLRSVHHWRAMVGVGPALQLARKPIPFEPCDLELRDFAAVLRAAPDALFVDPKIWAWSDFWSCFWLSAISQITLTRAEDFVSDAIAMRAIEALVPVAQQLLQDPVQRKLCEREIEWMMDENENNVFTQLPSFQLALDRLGLRRFAETCLLNREPTYRQEQQQQHTDGVPARLTFLNGNPYARPSTRPKVAAVVPH